MTNGVGRTAAFTEGSDEVRQPHFMNVQEPTPGYRRTSVLDSLQPTGNGFGEADLDRLKMGINRSAIGQSDSNFDKSLWLRGERPAALYQQTQD